MPKTIIVRAGKVPGIVFALPVPEDATLKQVMETAAIKGGFTFSTEPYPGPGDKTMLDVPFVNGKAAANVLADGKVESVYWDQVVEANQVILIIPKIKGNQITVHVGRENGDLVQVGLLKADDPEATGNDGTVEQALQAAKIEPTEDEYPTINNEEVDTNTAVADGDVIIIKKRDLMPILFGYLDGQIDVIKVERGATLAKVINDEFGGALEPDERAIRNGKTISSDANFSGIVVEENDSIIIVTVSETIATPV